MLALDLPLVAVSRCRGRGRVATGAVVLNGARLGMGAEPAPHAVVGVDTVVPAGSAVPMGWFAGGDPAELVPPDDWARIKAVLGPLDYPGTVFGIGESDTTLPDTARRSARGLALHRMDSIIPDHYH